MKYFLKQQQQNTALHRQQTNEQTNKKTQQKTKAHSQADDCARVIQLSPTYVILLRQNRHSNKNITVLNEACTLNKKQKYTGKDINWCERWKEKKYPANYSKLFCTQSALTRNSFIDRMFQAIVKRPLAMSRRIDPSWWTHWTILRCSLCFKTFL